LKHIPNAYKNPFPVILAALLLIKQLCFFLYPIIDCRCNILIYLVIQTTKSKARMGNLKETPFDILKKRYVKGKITKDAFDRTLKRLFETG